MRIFKNTWFNRFAAKNGITDNDLKEAANLVEAGLADADLGGGVYKVRVARSGEGKAGGYRVIVFFKSEEWTVFAYGFPKSARANISDKELKAYKSAAKEYFSLTPEQLTLRVKYRQLIEL